MEYTQTWASMEGMVEAGKCKAIGVSNFTQEQVNPKCYCGLRLLF